MWEITTPKGYVLKRFPGKKRAEAKAFCDGCNAALCDLDRSAYDYEAHYQIGYRADLTASIYNY